MCNIQENLIKYDFILKKKNSSLFYFVYKYELVINRHKYDFICM